MRIVRKAEMPREQGPESRFDGTVTLNRLVAGRDRVGISIVRFQDGARTNWHQHEEEQVLYILEGECRIGTASVAEEHLSAGDMVYLPGGERHWHGAAPGGSMAHLSITTGAPPEWYEKAP